MFLGCDDHVNTPLETSRLIGKYMVGSTALTLSKEPDRMENSDRVLKTSVIKCKFSVAAII